MIYGPQFMALSLVDVMRHKKRSQESVKS